MLHVCLRCFALYGVVLTACSIMRYVSLFIIALGDTIADQFVRLFSTCLTVIGDTVPTRLFSSFESEPSIFLKAIDAFTSRSAIACLPALLFLCTLPVAGPR